jgi:dihydropteroate synthase
MGVLNVTPDSFSDGGRFFQPQAAVQHAISMLDAGADIIDIGGESTRPGSQAAPETAADAQTGLPEDEELRRVMPVIEALRRERPQAILSIDTYKAAVARAAVEAGAEIVNDVSALRWDPAMAATVADLHCGVVLVHMRGRPADWRKLPPLEDGIALVSRELRQWAETAMAAGVARERIVLDPGFGFGKNFFENYPLLARFEELHRLGLPMLAGPSRKSFIGRTLARDGRDAPPDERLCGTLAAVTACILKGAHIVRVHDVRAAVDAARIADAILATS